VLVLTRRTATATDAGASASAQAGRPGTSRLPRVDGEVVVDRLAVERNFASLSLKDLLEARDNYHWHLTSMTNVVGTAVGLYYVRRAEPWPNEARSAEAGRAGKDKGPRTFANSEVRAYSWPCVLVLVDRWVEREEFGTGEGQVPPGEMVPRTLYMPDGRTVPVCVVKVDAEEPAGDLLPAWTWPKSVIGGGFPLIARSQGVDHVASVGGLVTDGHTVYALTSRHVAGPAGTPVSTLLHGRRATVGTSTSKQLTRLPLHEVYADFTARRTYLTLDAGLVEVGDLDQWTSQIYGLPPLGELADLSERNIGTRLIDAPVVAFGAASGRLTGRIAALFYRYRSIGGYDEVTDLLIAPQPGTPGSQPGDSGTLWHLREEGSDRLRPVALQWGGQSFVSAGGTKNFNFTLAANLSNVIRLLDVELVLDHNRGAQPFWGKTGHYGIAALACSQVTSPGLRTLMHENVDRISFPLDGFDADAIDQATKDAKKNGTFMPLADVPDLIWKNLATTVPGGRDTSFSGHGTTGPEHPTHYADIDVEDAAGATLRQRCVDDPANVAVPVWQATYDALGETASTKRGLLPFRVWQFYDELVAALTAGDLRRYVCAAGLMSHYVGDASQPLHGSHLADGIDSGPQQGKGKGVHSSFETYLVDFKADEILLRLPAAADALAQGPRPPITTGQEAAVAVVQLMDRAAHAIDAMALVEAYAATQTGQTKNPTHNHAVLDALWQQFGDATIDVLADGAVTLAQIWEAAWVEAGAEQRFGPGQLVGIDRDALRALYEDPGFVPSIDLDGIGAVLVPHA